MKEDKNRKRNGGDFLAGKGFYVVLFACVAIIGVSAWILLFTGGDVSGEPDAQEAAVYEYGEVESQDDDRWAVQPSPAESGDVFSSQTPAITPPPVKTPQVTPEPSAKPSAEPSPEPSAKPSAKPSAEPKTENADSGGTAKTLEEMTYVWPVAGKIEVPFSVDMPIYNRTLAVWKVHSGIDIAAPIGTKVLAIADGTVTDVYEDDLMGTTVVIDHGHKLKSIYSNLNKTPVVKPGDKIALGAVIGAVSDTALGEIGEVAHLHLEMTLDGDVVNPVGYLPSR